MLLCPCLPMSLVVRLSIVSPTTSSASLSWIVEAGRRVGRRERNGGEVARVASRGLRSQGSSSWTGLAVEECGFSDFALKAHKEKQVAFPGVAWKVSSLLFWRVSPWVPQP